MGFVAIRGHKAVVHTVKITESNGVYELKESNTTCARNFMHVMVRTGAKRYYWANGIRIFRAQSTDQGIARYLEG